MGLINGYHISFLTIVPCVCVYVCLHDNLFACGLQHHVLGPVIPALVGLGLVHDLLEHRPLPAQKQATAAQSLSKLHHLTLLI